MISADARPTKAFFIESMTRDLSLEDALLDLIDNSIDALIRRQKIDVSVKMLRGNASTTLSRKRASPRIIVHFSNAAVSVEDNCGGIDLEHAKTHVFRIGRVAVQEGSALGVFGIGLKRALFKIGSEVAIESVTERNGFSVALDVDAWKTTDDWTIPIRPMKGSKVVGSQGTRITISRLSSEAKGRLDDGVFEQRLSQMIATTYCLFLGRHVEVVLNDHVVKPTPLPIAESSKLQPTVDRFSQGKVHVELIAGLAARTDSDYAWLGDRAGWYVLCNGRVVVSADRTELTGWGGVSPQFVSKFRGFIGIAFFFSGSPAELPWTTMKRGLNREAGVFQAARIRMGSASKPVLKFLNSMYASEVPEKNAARTLTEELRPADLAEMVARSPIAFKAEVRIVPSVERRTSVQYDATEAELARIRKKLAQPRMRANRIGRHTLEHYLKTECPE